jgi:Tautomerase enzyme
MRCEISSSRTKDIVVCDSWFAAPTTHQDRHTRNSAMPLIHIAKPEVPRTAKRSRVASGTRSWKLWRAAGRSLAGYHRARAGIEIVRPTSYLGIEYSDNLTLIQLAVSDTRSVDQEQALFVRIVASIGRLEKRKVTRSAASRRSRLKYPAFAPRCHGWSNPVQRDT